MTSPHGKMDKDWPLPEDSATKKDGFVEQSPDNPVSRHKMTDVELAAELDVSVQEAHRKIEGVNERRSTDLNRED